MVTHDEPTLALEALTKLPDPVLILDGSTRIVLANQAAKKIFGTIDSDKRISAVIRTPSVVQAVSEVLDGASSQVVDYSNLVPVERHFRAHVMPLRQGLTSGGGGSTGQASEIYAVLILHDLTEVKRSEQMRADFVANASHELRTPLSSLTGFIETLRGHAQHDEAAREQFLAIMQAQAERMGRLIEDLLSLSRIEMNEHVPPEAAVDLMAVVNDVVDALAPKAKEAEANLVVSLEGKRFTRRALAGRRPGSTCPSGTKPGR